MSPQPMLQTGVPAPTVAQFKKLCRDIEPAARAVIMAQAFMELERERVDAYIRPIFDSYSFPMAERWTGRGYHKSITEPKDLYLCEDEPLCAAYYADCDDAHRAHGFTGPSGHCPALIAETLQRTTENLFIELTAPLFGLDLDDINRRVETRAKFLDLMLGAALKKDGTR